MKKKIIIIVLILISILVILSALYFVQKKYNIFSSQNTNKIADIKDDKTIEGKKLIIKDKLEFNKIIEFEFENNIVSSIKNYEQFENQEEYENAKESYESLTNFDILKQDDEEKYIFVEKKDFGTDTNLTYEQIYDKYLVQIVGAYELIK